MRGHGDSVVSDENEMSATTLAEDVAKVLDHLYRPTEDNGGGEQRPMPPVMLIGHSMGM